MKERLTIQAILAALSAAGGYAASLLGGWDAALKTLVLLMAADYVTGLLVAAVFKASPKTDSGTLDSRAGFRGLVRKFSVLLLVLAAAQLGNLLQDNGWLRDAAVLFFCANEGLSILENIGLMGVDYPDFLVDMLQALKKKEK